MNGKKGLRYYSIIFIISVIAVGIYTIIQMINGLTIDGATAATLIVIPLTFTILLFAFDKILEFIFPQKEKTQEIDDYGKFILKATEYLKENSDLEIEDFRKLRNSEKFQRALKHLHIISEDGESDKVGYKMVLSRFKKDSLEYRAIVILKSMEN